MRAPNVLLVCGAAALAACGRPDAPAGPFSADAPSVLLVTLDTTRADHLGCYGHAAARTPRLDALAQGGVRFERAYSQVPLTLPSHASMLSGVHPPGTGLHDNFEGAVSRDVPLLAEMFAASGYRTGAFVAAWVLSSEFGLDRGFEVYDDPEPDASDLGRTVERRADEVTDAFLAWFAQAPERRFFAWVHYYDAHDPYEPPPGYDDLASPYDGEVAYVDAQLGRILDALAAAGRREQTLVVVTGDHGEGLGDHGEQTHGLFVYDSTLHVPLLLSWPGTLEPRVVASAVGLVDLHPTVVELCGGRSSALVEGQSLAGAARGAPLAALPVYSECEYPLRAFGWAPLVALRTGAWKYVEAPRPELYAYRDDPGELHDVSATQPTALLALRDSLRTLRDGWTVRLPDEVELGAGASANLAALGYVEGAAPAERVLADLRDPKDCTELFIGAMRAKRLQTEDRHAEVVELCEELTARSPESDDLWSVLGVSLLELRRFEEARVALEKSLRVQPDRPGRLVSLGDAWLGLGQPQRAVEVLERAIAAAPSNARAHARLGLAFANLREFARAEAAFREQCRLEPASPNAHTNLANALFAAARFDEGLAEVDVALRHDPTCEPAWVARLQGLAAAGRGKDELATRMREALAALPQASRSFLEALLGPARAMQDEELVGELEARLGAR